MSGRPLVRAARTVLARLGRAPRAPSRRGVVALLLVLVAVATLTGGLLRVRVDTGTESFLPGDDPALHALRQQARDFGGDPVVVLVRYREPRRFLRDGADTLALLRLEGALAQLPDVASVYGPATVLNQFAAAAQDFLLRIAALRDGTREAAEAAARQAGRPDAAAAAAGQAAVDEVNLRYGPLLVRGMTAGLPTLKNPQFGRTVVFGPDGLARPDWRFVVPTPDTVVVLVRPRESMDQAQTEQLLTAIRDTVDAAALDPSSVTVSGVPTVTAELAGEVTDEMPLIAALVLVAVLTRFLVVPTARGRLHRLRPLIASVLGSAATLALAGWSGRPLSLGAVVLLPLLLGVGSSFPLYLAAVPNRRRIVVMSVASAAAFLALAVSPLPFVRDLGLALAAGVLLSVAAAVVLDRYWPPGALITGPAGPVATAPGRPRPPATPLLAAALAVATGLAVGGWAALPRLDVASNPVELARGLPALADAQVVESVIRASGEISVRLSGPDVLAPAALGWFQQARTTLDQTFADRLQPVVGVPTYFGFLGSGATAEQIDSALDLVPYYLRSSVVRPDRAAGLLVYGVRLQDLRAQERLLDEVRAALPPPPPGYTAELVGLPVAAVSGYRQLLADRYPANLAGIVAAGLVLAVGLRRRWDAARAVAAALLATGWALAAAWVLELRLTPLTMALGCLVSVTGCEFVVLLAEARRAARSWLWPSVAVACATSVLGYLALVPSGLWLVREFGLVSATAVVLSYLAARLVLWAFPPAPAGAEGTGPAVVTTPPARSTASGPPGPGRAHPGAG